MGESLFPIDMPVAEVEPVADAGQVSFGRSWRFDFAAGDFVLTPSGAVAGADYFDAWLQWCRKALVTERYRYLAYTRAYGQEFEDLIVRHLSRAANESEIRRMVTECLMLDPRTAAVENFTFEWDGDVCYFTCEISNVRGETGTVSSEVVIV